MSSPPEASSRPLGTRGASANFSRLVNVQNDSLRAPGEPKLDAPGKYFCGKSGWVTALHNGLNDIRRQESQADQSAYVADV